MDLTVAQQNAPYFMLIDFKLFLFIREFKPNLLVVDVFHDIS